MLTSHHDLQDKVDSTRQLEQNDDLLAGIVSLAAHRGSYDQLILTKLTVIRVTPPSALAAPTTAYTGGEMQGPSAGHPENSQAVG